MNVVLETVMYAILSTVNSYELIIPCMRPKILLLYILC